jgi:hypothetical protein
MKRDTFAVLSLFAFLVVAPAQAVWVEGGVHQPNVVGRNICFGVQAPRGLRAPLLNSSRYFESEKVTHEIVLEGVGQIIIDEDIVDTDQCRNLPTNSATWNADGTAAFCLASWDKGRFIKVGFRASVENEANRATLMSVLYAISACKVGDHPDTPSYGDTLKVGRGIPILNPR